MKKKEKKAAKRVDSFKGRLNDLNTPYEALPLKDATSSQEHCDGDHTFIPKTSREHLDPNCSTHFTSDS